MSGFQQQFARAEDVIARRYDYDDEALLVADLGVGADTHVDVVDDTAIVVRDDEQYEFDLPTGESRASKNNGVVTIEVKL